MAWFGPKVCALGLVGAGAVLSLPALAQDDENTTEGESAEEATTEPAASPAPAEAAADTGPDPSAEETGKEYHFVGLRYRGIVVPKFFQNLFGDGGRTVYVNGIGPEYVIRKDNFEFGLSPWLAFYTMDDTAFKGSSDPKEAWEIIRSNIKVLYLTSDFLWSKPISPKFAINYGFGAGLGIIFGDLHRNQSYPNGASDPNKYTKCPFDPATNPGLNPDGTYCDTENHHYGNYTEPSWFNGGSKPNLFPWLVGQTGLRFKPSPKFVARLDVGFGTSGFFFGLGADYGL